MARKIVRFMNFESSYSKQLEQPSSHSSLELHPCKDVGQKRFQAVTDGGRPVQHPLRSNRNRDNLNTTT